MPKTLNIHWKDNVYSDFAVDMQSLLDLCTDIKQQGAIESIQTELKALYDSMPEGNAKNDLNNVIKKVTDIQGFITKFVSEQSKRTSALNGLKNKKYAEGELGEGMYRRDAMELKLLLKMNKGLFFESHYDELEKKNVSKKGALPLDLRAALDSFHLNDDYNTYDKNEELFNRVDNLFNNFARMQNMLSRIYTLQDNYITTNRIKEHIDHKNTELKELGTGGCC